MYRTPGAAEKDVELWPFCNDGHVSFLSWMRCLLFGHKWVLLRTNYSKNIARCDLHRMAGTDQQCSRCAEIWADAERGTS
jgi:hypothetical protein